MDEGQRGNYGLKDKKLADMYIKMYVLGAEDAKKLMYWKDPAHRSNRGKANVRIFTSLCLSLL